jgi:HPt (histidine-containing phosphotransfer) domain-containing protein
MSEEKVTDISFLETFTSGNREKMTRYIRMFLDAAPGAISLMRTQLEAGEFRQLKTTAHSIKPQLSYMGIASLKEKILRIEEYAETGEKKEELSKLIEEVDHTCKIAFRELEDLIGKMA